MPPSLSSACRNGRKSAGVTRFHALRGHGAWLNDAPIRPHPAATVREGVMGVGTDDRFAVGDDRQRQAPGVQAVEETAGAIDGVDHPPISGWRPL
jgi:fructose-1,6-bisphosphatase/inositol monophosphatase family enzyme